MQGKWWEFAKAYEDSKAWQCWAGHGAAVRRAMDRAQRFFLPAGVDLSVGKRYEDVGDLLRLPFDTVAVMSETYSNEDWGTNRREALRTITLAVSAERPDSPAFGYMPAEHWPPGHKPWMLLIPLTRSLNPPAQFPGGPAWFPGGPATAVTKAESGGGLALHMAPVITPFTSELLRTGVAADELTNEVRDDLKSVVELCLLLGLQNVRSVLKPAPKGIAKARARKGKPPLFDYHVLEVDGELWDERAAIEQATGRGVRSHLRRGHIRRLSESRRVWVRACYVHGAEPGFAAKDYALNA